ncbi:hypothetical protein EIN_252980 [Entamoeba invadens IP1]|uniref:Uncharacterized protein n=1 Tax=Entamoeba invadens IP1 TaxID=370355 RepID=A0A0A1UGP9_ENTIV|nr:hypothetical protein EIN_252980 [Entamoeba invadens IP1]ELP95044.1 hypothetical protein EIN_252980 [Entamoeba invadens IP1]|eukprot:XP_004261815.1 hypothetical protein EIN_252980 [Entamoeba invadens IP1]
MKYQLGMQAAATPYQPSTPYDFISLQTLQNEKIQTEHLREQANENITVLRNLLMSHLSSILEDGNDDDEKDDFPCKSPSAMSMDSGYGSNVENSREQLDNSMELECCPLCPFQTTTDWCPLSRNFHM